MKTLVWLIRQFFKYFVLGFVWFYRWVISPITMSSCRHVPTCSQYMIEAIHRHGPGRGFLLGMNRLSRCHPWGTHGYDPVPQFVIRKYRTGQKGKTETILKDQMSSE